MRKSLKKYKFEIILFIIEAVCMSLELVASRVLSPYFGNSNIVWTSVIGIILLSSSLGNYYGGIIADRGKNERSLKYILMSASIFILIIPIIQKDILVPVSVLLDNIKIGAIISTIALFFLPSLLLGLVIPIVLRIKLRNIKDSGKTAGRIYAISTIGGIFGTFLSGFVLIPNFGSVHILFVLSLILLLVSLFVYSKFESVTVVVEIVIILLDIILFASYIKINNEYSAKVLNGDLNIKVSYDTQYGRVLIYNKELDGNIIRMLNIDSGYESATYIDDDKKYELVFDYTKYYDLMFKSKNEVNNVLLIGGAGYSYPKYYISHYEDKTMDVVEIDGDITKLAKEYFYLDKLIDDYKIDDNKRLILINEDGRTYLNRNKKKYDAILNDAFSGDVPAKTLTTIETITNIKNSLSEDGVYLTNIISSLEGNDSRFLRAEVNTLKQVFKNVYIVNWRNDIDLDVKRNVMVISTDQDIKLDDVYKLKLVKNEIVLTDDYAPIDTLID